MVESINAGLGSANVQRIAPTAAPPSAPVTAVARGDDGAASPATVSTRSLARQLSAAPPVDTERVAQIKKAIATGTFPILPATIADRLMALRLEWNPNDPA